MFVELVTPLLKRRLQVGCSVRAVLAARRHCSVRSVGSFCVRGLAAFLPGFPAPGIGPEAPKGLGLCITAECGVPMGTHAGRPAPFNGPGKVGTLWQL